MPMMKRRCRTWRQTRQVYSEVFKAKEIAKRMFDPAQHQRCERLGMIARPDARRSLDRDDCGWMIGHVYPSYVQLTKAKVAADLDQS
jgi:hypothetical protein